MLVVRVSSAHDVSSCVVLIRFSSPPTLSLCDMRADGGRRSAIGLRTSRRVVALAATAAVLAGRLLPFACRASIGVVFTSCTSAPSLFARSHAHRNATIGVHSGCGRLLFFFFFFFFFCFCFSLETPRFIMMTIIHSSYNWIMFRMINCAHTLIASNESLLTRVTIPTPDRCG